MIFEEKDLANEDSFREWSVKAHGSHVIALIVIRNPPLSLAADLLAPLKDANIPTLVYNNNSDDGVFASLGNSGSLLLSSDTNQGLAIPLTKALSIAQRLNSQWLWYFDQDSRISDELVEEQINSLNHSASDIAQVAVTYIDKNIGRAGYSARSRIRVPTTPIGSGSAFRVQACLTVGGIEPRLPLDMWDFEMSLRLQSRGYRVVVNPRTCMLHAVGNGVELRVFGANLVEEGHPPWRYEFKTRATYLVVTRYWRKYPKWCFRHIINRVVGFLVALLSRTDRREVFSYILRGALIWRPTSLPVP